MLRPDGSIAVRIGQFRFNNLTFAIASTQLFDRFDEVKQPSGSPECP
jgi:hypothetical protein